MHLSALVLAGVGRLPSPGLIPVHSSVSQSWGSRVSIGGGGGVRGAGGGVGGAVPPSSIRPKDEGYGGRESSTPHQRDGSRSCRFNSLRDLARAYWVIHPGGEERCSNHGPTSGHILYGPA